ncbi:MAG: hypothetical protein EOO29_09530 [Comamonadaceae bacterium]|nr:MAG: hypothetical protein EOO29_09530 [Comamonadaceae bacterium]
MHHIIMRRLSIVAAALALAACGGGDSNRGLVSLPVTPPVVSDPTTFCATAFDRPAASARAMAAHMGHSNSKSAGADLQPAVAAPAALPLTRVVKRLSQCDLKQGVVKIGSSEGSCATTVVIDQSFTRRDGNALGHIEIEADGWLGTPEKLGREFEIETTGISVAGTLSIGTAECRIGNADDSQGRVKLTFLNDPAVRIDPEATSDGSKGINVHAGGVLRMYGAKGVQDVNGGVNWAHLSQPAGPAKYQNGAQAAKPVLSAQGDRTLHLAKDVRGTKAGYGWQAGDWIVVATSSFSPFESEFVQIQSIEALEGGGSKVQLQQPLRHYHFGSADPGAPGASNFNASESTNFGVDERTEVGLISRSIRLTAETPPVNTASQSGVAIDPAQHWGGEIMIMAGFAEARIQGVELEKLGKARKGSYPIHFHLVGNAAGKTLVDSNSIHHSYNKCVTVHQTQNLSVTNNVCARAVGHLFYQEIAQEQGGAFIGNLGIGAMSHYFGLSDSLPKASDGQVKGWWEGDNLALQAGYNYNSLNVPNRDSQQNPMTGGCYRTEETNGNLPGLALPPNPQYPYHPANPGVPCAAGTLYVEPPSGFWIGNPGTRLTGNSIAGCQGIGKGYWYVAPPQASSTVKFEELGEFDNNRVHACYDGLFNEAHNTYSEQLFPKQDGVESNRNVVAHFKGLTATRIRYRGAWVRPVWNALTDSRFATNRDSVTLLTTGGPDGNAPGAWGLLKDSVVVGLSTNNVDRWGPCIDPGDPANAMVGINKNIPRNSIGYGVGCVDFGGVEGTNGKAFDYQGQGYQTPKFNSAGYMIYDGPARIIDNRFVNFKVDISDLLTAPDRQYLSSYVGYARPAGFDKSLSYEGDAALGWFQGNQSAYPTASVTKGLTFQNVDFRHQIYTEHVNLGDFRDGDKNTAVIDLDGTLTGYKIVDKDGNPVPDEFPISLNNLPFNRNGNAVDECLATGAQDAVLEGRATSLISPANMASLEFEALKPGAVIPHWQDMLFTKDSLDAGVHQSMRLQSRNGLGVWEPKVASGASYSVQPLKSTVPGITGFFGTPKTLQVGLTDAVKSKLSKADPFHVRVGICYQGQNGAPQADVNPFTVVRGYKSWGASLVNFDDPELKHYFNRYNGGGVPGTPRCYNLDGQDPGNLDPGSCPFQGVIPVPKAGSCPVGSEAQGGQCVFKTQTYQPVDSLLKLTDGQGKPVGLDKYFYDKASGMLYFYVVQDSPNARGHAPLGSCLGDNPHPTCPGPGELDTYYPCPPEGCTTVRVTVNDASYVPASTPGSEMVCNGVPIYGPGGAAGVGGAFVPEPALRNWLGDAATGAVVTTTPQAQKIGEKTFTHWTAKQEPASCVPTPVTPLRPSTTRAARADSPRVLELANLRAATQARAMHSAARAQAQAQVQPSPTLAARLWTDFQALAGRVLGPVRATGIQLMSFMTPAPDIEALARAQVCTSDGLQPQQPLQPLRIALR